MDGMGCSLIFQHNFGRFFCLHQIWGKDLAEIEKRWPGPRGEMNQRDESTYKSSLHETNIPSGKLTMKNPMFK